MNVFLSAKASKILKKLPKDIQEKARKAFTHLTQDPYHPSLYSRKMVGSDLFEARIDYHYRFTYFVESEVIIVAYIGMHDTGLGKSNPFLLNVAH